MVDTNISLGIFVHLIVLIWPATAGLEKGLLFAKGRGKIKLFFLQALRSSTDK